MLYILILLVITINLFANMHVPSCVTVVFCMSYTIDFFAILQA